MNFFKIIIYSFYIFLVHDVFRCAPEIIFLRKKATTLPTNLFQKFSNGRCSRWLNDLHLACKPLPRSSFARPSHTVGESRTSDAKLLIITTNAKTKCNSLSKLDPVDLHSLSERIKASHTYYENHQSLNIFSTYEYHYNHNHCSR